MAIIDWHQVHPETGYRTLGEFMNIRNHQPRDFAGFFLTKPLDTEKNASKEGSVIKGYSFHCFWKKRSAVIDVGP